jgi:predicted metal-binding protein
MKADVVIRSVECLNGCYHPAMAALSTPGKSRIRLCNLTEEDAPQLVEAALAHGESEFGTAEATILPATLLGKLSEPAASLTSSLT